MFTRSYSRLAGLLALVFLAACSSGQEDKDGLVVMKGVPVYRIPQGATVVKSDAMNPFDVNAYDRLFNHHPSINQPVYRVVTAPAYSVYVGLVLDKEISGPQPDLFAGDSAWRLVETRKVPQGTLGLLANDSLYDVRFVGHSPKTDITHLINLKTRDSVLAASYYHADSLYKGDCLL